VGKRASLKVTQLICGGAGGSPVHPSGGRPPKKENRRDDGWTGGWAEPWPQGRRLQALGFNPFLLLRSATAATAPPAGPAGEGGPPAPPPNLTSNRRLQQTQAQVDEVSVCVCWGEGRYQR
jgi:hypothetical protein